MKIEFNKELEIPTKMKWKKKEKCYKSKKNNTKSSCGEQNVRLEHIVELLEYLSQTKWWTEIMLDTAGTI